jgi:hypothetical protein
VRNRPITVDVTVSTTHVIPPTPPPEVLAELDAAVRALAELSARDAELTLALDDAHRLQIELHDDGGLRALTPTELFALLSGA